MKEALKLALEALECATPHKIKMGDDDYLENSWSFHNKAIAAIKEALAQPEQEPLTLMNNLALIIAGDAMGYRELVWNLSGKVMAVAMSAELVKGQANRVQVTAEAMSNLRKFVEEEVTRRLAFHNKLFDAHTTAAWKLNTNPTWRTFVGLTKEKISDHQCRRLLYGFMLDFNAVGFEQAGRNLHRAIKRAIKEATNDVKE